MRPNHLGALEMAVLDYLWETGEGNVKAVHAAIGQPRGITANTVQSTLKRLFHKQILTRAKVSHAYVYCPALSRRAFHRSVLDGVVGHAMKGDPESLLVAFVDLAERELRAKFKALSGASHHAAGRSVRSAL